MLSKGTHNLPGIEDSRRLLKIFKIPKIYVGSAMHSKYCILLKSVQIWKTYPEIPFCDSYLHQKQIQISWNAHLALGE